MPKRIVIVTTTRADWGILSPLARGLHDTDGIALTIAAGNMHLMAQYGNTIDEIRRDGFDDIECLDIPDSADDGSAQWRTEVAARTATSLARVIAQRQPDAIVILGDRYEMLGAATAALIADVPIVHLHGGETSLGAIDDSVRHAITKMASLHLTATERARQRVVEMGQPEDTVIHTGAIGVENAMSVDPMPIDDLRKSLEGFDIDPDRTLLVTFHPVTRHPDNITSARQIDNLLGALDDNPHFNAIITYPNNDLGSQDIITSLRQFANERQERIKLVPSLGKVRYLSALRHVRAVVGNSSSGLLEAPATAADTIDIGPRQQGRERANSVIHVDDSREAIADAIASLATRPRRIPDPDSNPYYRSDSVRTATLAIERFVKLL